MLHSILTAKQRHWQCTPLGKSDLGYIDRVVCSTRELYCMLHMFVFPVALDALRQPGGHVPLIWLRHTPSISGTILSTASANVIMTAKTSSTTLYRLGFTAISPAHEYIEYNSLEMQMRSNRL